MSNLVSRDYWEEVLKPANLSGYRCPFHKLLLRHLPKTPGLTFLEVGCAPGGNLVYFHRAFGYEPHGLDFVANIDIVAANLRASGIEQFHLYNQDLLDFQPAQAFDVVGNFGFIEHFTDWPRILERIVALVRPGGHVVTSLPHFRGGQYWLRRWLTPDVFARHNLEVMDPARLVREFRRLGLEVLYGDFYLTFDFWGADPPSATKRAVLHLLERFGWVMRKHEINILPSRWLSPIIVVIARKPQ